MIFLILVAFVAIIVISLNMYDNSNKKEIEDFFKSKKCENIIYSKGKYKGVCSDSIMQISNSFSVDLEKNRTVVLLKDIKEIEIEENSIVVNKTYTMEFKDEKNKETFYKSLKEKIDK